ncbi:MAG: hypothetical protein WA947_18335 [Phormidesmis sp.]
MLPDSEGLCQQAHNSDDLRSSEHRSDKVSSDPQSFDKFPNECDRAACEGKREACSTRKKRAKLVSQYVQETLDDYLALWPHRFDYIHAPHPDPGEKPNWQTESRHPLSDRIIAQGADLLGVRPGSETTYALLDIDKGSPYHDRRDPLAIRGICEALEPLGLLSSLPLTSSHSGGRHLYFPISEALPSWQLGLVVTTLLENKGFKVRPGWLEVFPNRKPFAADGSYSLFNGHRLPLQQGSYLLNDDLQPIASSQTTFVRQWHLAAAHNDISIKVIEQTIRQAQRKAYRLTGKAQKFLNDLFAEIEPGWSGPGQTNRILGRIAMRSYIFGHILGAEAPLTGKALAEDIARVTRALPGFKDFCGHQDDLDRRAKDYAKSIEDSPNYYPYASGKVVKPKEGPTENQQRALEARENIRQTTLELCRQNLLPETATARFELLCAYGTTGGGTLYKNRDLWHPDFISERQKLALQVKTEATCAVGAAASKKVTSLLGATARNEPSDNDHSDSISPESVSKQAIARNEPADAALRPSEPEKETQVVERTPPPKQLALNIQWAIQVARSKQRAQVEKNQQQYRQDRRLRLQAEYIARLQRWADSGDPILVAEAQRQLGRLAESSDATQGSG